VNRNHYVSELRDDKMHTSYYCFEMKVYYWSLENNELLHKGSGVSYGKIVLSIRLGKVVI